MSYCTYIVYDFKNKKSYIGSSSVKKVKRGYKGSTSSGRYHEIKKKRPQDLNVRILTSHSNRDEAYSKEQEILDKYFERLYNISSRSAGADPKLMSERMRGDKNPMYGVKPWCYGKKRPEHSKKMSGVNHPNYGKKLTYVSESNRINKGKHFLDSENRLWRSSYEAAEYWNVSASTIRNWLNGQKSIGKTYPPKEGWTYINKL